MTAHNTVCKLHITPNELHKTQANPKNIISHVAHLQNGAAQSLQLDKLEKRSVTAQPKKISLLPNCDEDVRARLLSLQRGLRAAGAAGGGLLVVVSQQVLCCRIWVERLQQQQQQLGSELCSQRRTVAAS
jgi:hypothetical protein